MFCGHHLLLIRQFSKWHIIKWMLRCLRGEPRERICWCSSSSTSLCVNSTIPIQAKSNSNNKYTNNGTMCRCCALDSKINLTEIDSLSLNLECWNDSTRIKHFNKLVITSKPVFTFSVFKYPGLSQFEVKVLPFKNIILIIYSCTAA